jgi:hypothetical protein
MADFNIRTDAVDVEQIMRQIRARIQEKRGVDYTEEQIQELANVKLERFLDPKGVRSDLVQQFKQARQREPDLFEPRLYSIDANDLYGSSRGIVRIVRKMLNPILKLFLNANKLVQVLDRQTEINALYAKQLHLIREHRDEVEALYYELVHNLVLELTRIGIEHRNVKMRLESLSSRMDFDERRARALEGVVQYRPGTGPARDPAQQPARSFSPQPAASPAPQVPQVLPATDTQGPSGQATDDQSGESSTTRRRRRRRRGRRGGRGRAMLENETTGPSAVPSSGESATPPHGDQTGEAALDNVNTQPDFEADSDSGEEDEGPDPSQQ